MCSKLMLDTNVLMHNPEFLVNAETDLYIPMIVIEELGELSHDKYSTGYFAREANRMVEYFVKEGKVHLVNTNKENIEKRFEDVHLHDNQIINTALLGNYVLVTDDTNMRIKCNLVGVKSRPSHERISIDTILNPYEQLKLSDEEAAQLYEQGSVSVNDKRYAYGLAHIGDAEEPIAHVANTVRLIKRAKRSKRYSNAKPIKPKNVKQLFLLNALADKTVKLVTAIGAAGTGKTLLALYSAIEQVIAGVYDKMYIIINPVHVGGKDKIGFLPGELHSKLQPYVEALYDNLDIIYNGDVPAEFADLFDSHLADVVALDFLRGRTLHNAFVLVDEVQNYNRSEIKTVVTRVSDSSKIALLGDIEQIDAKIAPDTTGIFVTANKFFGKPYARHIVLDESERGELSQDASRLL